METEQIVENYLICNHIPYKKNVIFKNKKITSAEFDFIIPNAVIEVKGGIFNSEYSQGLEKLFIQLIRIKSYIPSHFKIYYFFRKCLPNDVYDLLVKNGAIVLYDLKNLIYDYNNSDYVFYTCDTAVLRSMASVYNTEFELIKQLYNPIVVPVYIYMRAIANIADEELARLNQIQFKFIEDTAPPQKYIYLTIKNLSYSKNWNIFYVQFPYYVLKDTQKMLLIDGITITCSKCKNIKFEESVEDNICSKCVGYRNKKRKPEVMLPIKSLKRQRLNNLLYSYKVEKKDMNIKPY